MGNVGVGEMGGEEASRASRDGWRRVSRRAKDLAERR